MFVPFFNKNFIETVPQTLAKTLLSIFGFVLFLNSVPSYYFYRFKGGNYYLQDEILCNNNRTGRPEQQAGKEEFSYCDYLD
jgi:hypothetical protein